MGRAPRPGRRLSLARQHPNAGQQTDTRAAEQAVAEQQALTWVQNCPLGQPTPASASQLSTHCSPWVVLAQVCMLEQLAWLDDEPDEHASTTSVRVIMAKRTIMAWLPTSVRATTPIT